MHFDISISLHITDSLTFTTVPLMDLLDQFSIYSD